MENDFILLKRIRDICFFVFCTILFLFLSFFIYIDANALAVDQEPVSIKSNTGNSVEYYNKYNNGIMWEPRDTGGSLPYFNTLPCQLNFSPTKSADCPVSHYHQVDNVDFEYNNMPGSSFTLYYNVYYYGYWYGPQSLLHPLNNSWILQNDSDDISYVPDTLEMQFITNPNKVDYQCSNGICSSSPVFEQGYYNQNGGWVYSYHVSISNPTSNGTFWLKARPYVANDKTDSGFTVGIKIVEVVSGSSSSSYADLISNDNANTNNIISNIVGIPGKIINGISSLLNTLWSNISGVFTTLFGWLSNILNTLINILSDDTPTSEWLSNYINNFPGINENIIAQIITLPIHILTKLIGVNTCTPVILGNMYGTTLTLPCLSTILSNILGSLINIVGWMVAFYIYYIMFVKIKDLLFEMLTLEGNVARKMKINF